MKTTLSIIFFLVSFFVKGQTSDIMYIPDEKSLVVTYNSNYSGFGIYVGGYITSSFPQSYLYTTPQSRANRFGISVTNHKISIMGGVFADYTPLDIELKPDVWVKIYPLRILLNNKSIPDFTVGVNYNKGIRLGIGLSFPFSSIY